MYSLLYVGTPSLGSHGNITSMIGEIAFQNTHVMHNTSLAFGTWKRVSPKRRSILTTKFVFVLVTKSTQQNKKKNKINSETTMSYRHLTYQPRFDAGWKALCIASINVKKGHSFNPHVYSLNL